MKGINRESGSPHTGYTSLSRSLNSARTVGDSVYRCQKTVGEATKRQ